MLLIFKMRKLRHRGWTACQVYLDRRQHGWYLNGGCQAAVHKTLTHVLYDSTEAEFGVCCPLCVKSDSMGRHSLAESSKGRRPVLSL